MKSGSRLECFGSLTDLKATHMSGSGEPHADHNDGRVRTKGRTSYPVCLVVMSESQKPDCFSIMIGFENNHE